MRSKSFEEALSDLEMLADIRFNLRPSEFFKFRNTYNRKIIQVLNTIYGRFSDMISKQALQYLQRLTAVRAKLSDYMSTHGTEQMNRLVKVCLRATEAAIDQADKIPVTAWVVAVDSFANSSRVTSTISLGKSSLLPEYLRMATCLGRTPVVRMPLLTMQERRNSATHVTESGCIGPPKTW